ncbi:hypothetical protein TELCIR_12669 [Teladorsagia circumcincta]|uniref:Uncharacterized protein n=1 Tax=Teladorsagia circumcincta TaxID=45464 RepID=A0A2G9U5Z9_TELCI|nr:hypothetical protein TELCIR_12669 [Teladorsagia circumcincta]
MRGLLVLSACLFLSCFASPVLQKVEAVEKDVTPELDSTAYAVDLLIPISLSGFQCIRQNQYSTAFIRLSCEPTAYRAYTHVAGLQAEAYMSPQPQSSKTGAQQFDEMYFNLKNADIDVQSVWIQVRQGVFEKIVSASLLKKRVKEVEILGSSRVIQRSKASRQM